MSTTQSTHRSTSRSSTVRHAVAALGVTAIVLTVPIAPGHPAPAPAEPTDRPCFIVQARWNVAIDGPAPTCPKDTRTQGTTTDDSATGRPVVPLRPRVYGGV